MLNTTVRIALLATLALILFSCENIERATPKPEPVEGARAFDLDVSPVMTGTVSSQAILDGYQPTIVRGYGLVVGLRGTGSRDIPPALRAQMIQEMARHGIGSARQGMDHLKPEQMLDSPDTAVVIVEAVIPPGSVKGTKFDVRVLSDPRTGTTSLEGGRLYTTELRPGELKTGSQQASALATAGGPVFVNPFAEPGATNSDTIIRNNGRILNGGTVTENIPLKLRLAVPSHTRAQVLQNTINARFPQERGQRDPTARGESESSIEITVPPSYRNDSREFVELLMHTTLRLSNAESVAASIKRSVMNNPLYAREAAWRWRALGPRCLPIIKDLYDYPEELPRLAALQAGAKLSDPLVIPHLVDLSRNASHATRKESIELLGGMDSNPRIDRALRELLNDPDTELRLTAYEALIKRGDPYLARYNIDNKFMLDVIESSEPLVYVAQIGMPRIAVFGNPSIDIPCLISTWSNRLMIDGREGSEQLEVFYRAPDAQRPVITQADPDLDRFIAFLAHRPTPEYPEPGLGLTYGETVGAVHHIWRSRYLNADFKAEQDRILAAIMDVEQESTIEPRPEFAEEELPWLDEGMEADQSAPIVPSDLPVADPDADTTVPR